MSGLVIFGASNIVSDLFDCALACGLRIDQVVIHLPEPEDPRSTPLAQRVAALAAHGMPPTIIALDQFVPQPGQQYLLGPTTPTRAVLAQLLEQRFGLEFCTLVHPTAYVSPLATLGPGVFVGANSAIGPGAKLAAHVFVNRGVTIGHDTRIAAFARVQPGANVGGLGEIGAGATIGIGATVIERVVIGAACAGGGRARQIQEEPGALTARGTPARRRR